MVFGFKLCLKKIGYFYCGIKCCIMKIHRFEELDIWILARDINKIVIQITTSQPFANDIRFKNQIRSSSGSIMDNIAEGFDRGGTKEFKQFLSISKGSNGELRSQCYRAYDCEFITEKELAVLLDKTGRLAGKITNLMIYLSNTSKKGIKYD